MELKQFSHRELKAINNGKLPGFYNGYTPSSQQIGNWNSALYNYNNAKQSVDLSDYYKRGEYNFSGYKTGDQLVNDTNGFKLNVGKIDINTGEEKKDDQKLSTSSTQPTDKASMFIGGAASTIANTINAFTDYAHEDDILGARKTSTGYVGGIPYQMKTIDRSVLEYHKNGKLPKYAYGKNILNGVTSGASAGGTFGPYGAIIGAAVGGIAGGIGSMFASDSEAEALSNAQRYTANENSANLNSAATTRLQIDNAKKYGNGDTRIYRFNCGKLPKYDLGKVATAFGQMYGEPNAKVSNGEVIAREIAPGQFSAYRVPGMKNNKDGKLALLGNNDYVITNKNGASDIAATGNIEGGINHMISTGKPSYKQGKLPKFEEGWLGNAIPATAGILAGLGQYLDARNSKVYRPNTYSENPYELEGLSTLAGLRINPYPVMDELRKSEARTNRAIDIAGGLSGGQRTGARLANLNTTQNNISKLLQNIQQQNNAYKANYAQAAINAGQASRQARMAANQWDLDYYSKAHAARNKGMQVGIANMLAQIQQYQANEFKRRQFNDTMDLYRSDQEQRQQHMNWLSSLPTSRITGLGFDSTRRDPMKQLFYYDDKTGQYVPYNG